MSVEKSIVLLIRQVVNKNKVVKVEILLLVREESELVWLELFFACRYFCLTRAVFVFSLVDLCLLTFFLFSLVDLCLLTFFLFSFFFDWCRVNLPCLL